VNDRTIYRLQDIIDAIDQIDGLLKTRLSRMLKQTVSCEQRLSGFWKS